MLRGAIEVFRKGTWSDLIYVLKEGLINSVKNNILGFVDHTVSLADVQFPCCFVKTAISNS